MAFDLDDPIRTAPEHQTTLRALLDLRKLRISTITETRLDAHGRLTCRTEHAARLTGTMLSWSLTGAAYHEAVRILHRQARGPWVDASDAHLEQEYELRTDLADQEVP